MVLGRNSSSMRTAADIPRPTASPCTSSTVQFSIAIKETQFTIAVTFAVAIAIKETKFTIAVTFAVTVAIAIKETKQPPSKEAKQPPSSEDAKPQAQ